MTTSGIRIGIKPGQWGWRFEELTAAWERAESLGFDVLSCFDHSSAAPRSRAAWDAPTLLTAMAGRTDKIALAVDVINVNLRHPFLLAGQLAVAQAASGGRLEVGLGAGSFDLARFDHEVLGIPFPRLTERLARLEACVRTMPALWRGETVTDSALGLERASLGPLGIDPPPLIVGGASPGILELAVRDADGWNIVIESAQAYDDHARTVNELCRRLRRARPLRRHVQIFADAIDPAVATEMVDRLAAHGATTVVFVLSDNHDPGMIDRIAKAVLS